MAWGTEDDPTLLNPVAPPVERMARTRVRKIFGVAVPERRLVAGLGALAGMKPIIPGGGFNNFLQNFSSALGAGMGATGLYDENQRRNEEAQSDIDYKNWMMTKDKAATDERTAAKKNYDDLIKLGVDPQRAMNIAYGIKGEEEAEDYGVVDPTAMGPLAPGQVRAPAGVPRGGYKQYAEGLGRKAADPDTGDEATDAATEMDDATLRMTALMYAKTGQLPPLGMGKGAALSRTKILNYAAHNFPQLDVASNKLDYSRNQKSLDNVTKIYDAASAWEETASRNADVMLKALEGIPDTGTRFGNKVSRYLASQVGDPKVAAFNTARETIKVEYARLLSSPGVGNSVLSDAARKEIEGVLSGDYTKAQMVRALNVLKQDAKNRKTAYNTQIEDIRARMAWNQAGGQTQKPARVIRINGQLVEVEE